MSKDKLQVRRERELRRYRSVVNATGDVKLARELRARSDAYIYQNYGIKVNKKPPKLKVYTKETRYKKQLEVRRYRYAIERGIKPQEALKLKKRSFKYIEEKARYYTPVEPPKTVKAKPVELSRDARIKKWSSWSEKKNREGFPPFIKNKAQQINVKMGFDVNSKYGFTVMFYAYIENEPTSKWLKLIQADRVTEMAVYKTQMILV